MPRTLGSRESRMREIRTYGLMRERASYETLSTLLQSQFREGRSRMVISPASHGHDSDIQIDKIVDQVHPKPIKETRRPINNVPLGAIE
jgi:hypothetical protein